MDIRIARILLIDDDPMILGILRYLLEQEYYEVLEARTGAKGLQLAAEGFPDAILLDIKLPDISGFDVCQQLKASEKTKEIPVIFLTGVHGHDYELRGFYAGAIDFLCKPINPPVVCARVNNALEVKFTGEQLKQQANDLDSMNARLKLALGVQEKVTHELQQRDAILSAVNYVASAFLRSENWKGVISDVLCFLGEAVNCKHVYFMTLDSPVDQGVQYDWFAGNGSKKLSSFALFTTDQDVKTFFTDQEPVVGSAENLSGSLKNRFTANNIGTFLILPVYVDHVLWGCLGFDCVRVDRQWSEPLVNAMTTATDLMGIALQRAHESRERQRQATAISQFSDCILMTDDNGIIFYANPASENITGYTPEELVGLKLQDIQLDNHDDIDCQQVLDSVSRTGEEWRRRRRNVHKDGTLYDEAVTVIPFRDSRNETNSFVIIKRDETETKRLESIAEAANLMDNVGFVFSGIRHELGNPLNSLKMAISVLRKQLDGFSPDKIREFLDRSMNEINRMEYLLYSLKNFNVFEDQNLVPLDLAAFLENFKKLHENDLRKKGIKVQLRVIHRGIAMVDERALHQVMLNLLTNAVNALEGVEKPQITFQLVRKRRNFMQIRVVDNGCGFSGLEGAQLFKPFFTTRAKGTGLGLTIVKKMLTSMNCTVSIRRGAEAGALIIITLPEGADSSRDHR
jgi:PAS domain S-box-containing protein